MTDLWIAAAGMTALSSLLFALGASLAPRLSPRAAAALAFAACAFILGFIFLLSDHLVIARLLPFSNVILLGDALPPAVALLAGVAWGRIPGAAWRRSILVAPFLMLCALRSYGLAFGDPPPLGEGRWKDGVCRQTTPASCSAAAAATLLKAYGIPATEAEMARLCLTRESGTTMHGLYRGLRLKTRATPWEVESFRGDVDSLRRETGPVILTVRLDPGPGVDERYERDWGWAAGVRHTIVFFGIRDDGKTDVGDPSVGRENWRAEDVRLLWHGEGVRLRRRPDRSETR